MEPIVLSASTYLIQALSTDVWQRVRDRVAALLDGNRPMEGRAVAAELEAARAQVLAAREEGDRDTEVALAGKWSLRIQERLREDASLDEELRQLVSEELIPAAASERTGRLVTPHAGFDEGNSAFTAGEFRYNFVPPPVEPSAFTARLRRLSVLPVPPRTLPRADPLFVGREREISELRDYVVHRPQESVHALYGMAGVGKTSLAVRLAHDLSAGFPDGQVFVNLRAHGPDGPAEPQEVLGRLLPLLSGHDARIPSDAESKAAMWRDLLADRRALLVLDDAADAQQVEPLLPGTPDCLVLITSRRRLAEVPGVRPHFLDVLGREAAVELFLRASRRGHQGSREAGSAEQVADACGRLPLALSLVGSRMAHRPAWSVENLLDRLASADTRLTEIRAGRSDLAQVFDAAYRTLDADGAKLLDAIALHPGPEVDGYAAAELAAIELPAALSGLEELAASSFLSEVAPDRYRMHPLLRLFLNERTGAERREELGRALERLLNYYAVTAARAAELSSPTAGLNRERWSRPLPSGYPALRDRPAALRWAKDEGPNLWACAAYTRGHGSRGLFDADRFLADVRRLTSSAAPRLNAPPQYGDTVSTEAAPDRETLRSDLSAWPATGHETDGPYRPGPVTGRDWSAVTRNDPTVPEVRDIPRSDGDHGGSGNAGPPRVTTGPPGDPEDAEGDGLAEGDRSERVRPAPVPASEVQQAGQDAPPAAGLPLPYAADTGDVADAIDTAESVDAQVINFWILDGPPESTAPLAVGHPYRGCFQVGPDHPANLAAGDRVVPAEDIPAAGLPTTWLVRSTTVDLAVLPGEPSDITVSKASAGERTQCMAQFDLVIPPSGLSEARTLQVVPLAAEHARIDVTVLVEGDVYRELAIELRTEDGGSTPPGSPGAASGGPETALSAGPEAASSAGPEPAPPAGPDDDPSDGPETGGGPAGGAAGAPTGSQPGAPAAILQAPDLRPHTPPAGTSSAATAVAPARPPGMRVPATGAVTLTQTRLLPAAHTRLRPAQPWQRPRASLNVTLFPPNAFWELSSDGDQGAHSRRFGQVAWEPEPSAEQRILKVREALDQVRVLCGDRDGAIAPDDVAERLARRRPRRYWGAPGPDHVTGEAEAAWDEVAASRELRGLAFAGARLFDALFPAKSPLRARVRNLGPGDSLRINWSPCEPYALPHVPWALMYCGAVPPAGSPVDPQMFLGMRLRLAHLAHSRPSDRALEPRATRAHLLYWGDPHTDETGDESLRHRAELAPWSPLFLPIGTTGRKEELSGFLTRPDPRPVSLLYLFCKCATGSGASPTLRFGSTNGDDDVLELMDIGTSELDDQPLVFVNACDTSTADPYFTNELQSLFLQRGCRAYIGSECKVPTSFAARFATVFFHFLYAGPPSRPTSAGEALVQARRFFWDEYRSLGGLFYNYVNDDLVFLAGARDVAGLQRPF